MVSPCHNPWVPSQEVQVAASKLFTEMSHVIILHPSASFFQGLGSAEQISIAERCSLKLLFKSLRFCLGNFRFCLQKSPDFICTQEFVHRTHLLLEVEEKSLKNRSFK